jgi:cyclohexanone monooxygenase
VTQRLHDLDLDVAIVGAGFAGLYLLHKLRGMGFKARVFEAADDVGGVWYWNRYPGARCDVESLQYSFSFSDELQQEWQWTERYAGQAEILRYIRHVAERFDLRRDIVFKHRIEAMHFDARRDCWQVHGPRGAQGTTPITARFCIMATGPLSAARWPEFTGLAAFQGGKFHTGAWPHEGVDFTGLRVGVIGTGSSGIQAIPRIAEQAAQLTVFQRTPNFSIPAWNRPLTDQAQSAWKARYAHYRAQAREVGSLYEFSDRTAMQATPAEREQEFERRWKLGGVNFVHSFNDLMVNEKSNETIAEFVRAKIRATVKDPERAAILSPTSHPLGTKRICVDTGYFETYNRPNVSLVDLKKTPIARFSEHAVHTTATAHELDAIVFATGYDALTGALARIEIRGLEGRSLADKWAHGPRTYLGLMSAGFPNLFIITGPGSPSVLVNVIVGIEHHVEWISICLARMREHKHTRIDATLPAEDRWVEHVNAAAARTLFPRADSWFLGANIPGKPRVFMPYVAKIGVYRRECEAVAEAGYEGFALTPERGAGSGNAAH